MVFTLGTTLPSMDLEGRGDLREGALGRIGLDIENPLTN
ncbi:hypothetical protein EV05_0972 [Prochlorococcus sp. MIT 0601]|nr:hypothetical protein EV05_0972 [Prochlorococcus sp. MIT 0601]